MKNKGMKEFQFTNLDEIENVLYRYIKRNIGPGTYLSERKRISDNIYIYKIGNTYPAFVHTPSNKVPIIKFLKFPVVGTIRIERKNNLFKVSIPSREDIIQKGKEKYNSLIVSAENILLDKTYSKIVKIPLVQTAMSKIREILIQLEIKQEINLFDYYPSEREKLLRYLKFLEDMDYVRKEKGKYIEGNRLSVIRHKLKGEEPTELYTKIMADILRKGYTYMSKHLRLLQIVPYLRIANSYYFPSYEFNELLSIDKHRFTTFIADYINLFYNYRTPEYKLNNQINDVVRCGILKEEENYYTGYEKIFNEFSRDFNAL
ncbi:MAG TPA: hypothetical protein ENI33_09690 [Thermoplasmatales archaeon]|nr:hypothetical protein [Thermoplasmatales archaeon]